ncbi:uncharacterized protein LOC110986305 isoform X2 [Acanthaster planci]|uniref:Uncharacterized protein LOC110986305 isoform X2 n=1 Tax=Acanthaster planci TaxID=133434 RepID=A0A8B7ZFI9_ACAPL|nr:uncharacterized protein LOC110986305 isoform X2 [Acanthaster planci]
MASRYWHLLLSLLSLTIVLQNCFVNVDLTRQSTQCLDRLREAGESGEGLRERLRNATEDLVKRQQVTDEEIQTARGKLFKLLKELHGERDHLKFVTRLMEQALEKKRLEREEKKDNTTKNAKLLAEKERLVRDLKEVKRLLRIVQEKGNIEENGGAGAEGNKTVAA